MNENISKIQLHELYDDDRQENTTVIKHNGQEMLTEKQLQAKYQFNKLKSDNVFKSARNYIKKYYKPSSNCNLENLV